MNETLIIMAGGASSRMKKSESNLLSKKMQEQANKRSKGLIELGGKPFMDYLLLNAVAARYKSIYIITGENSELFRSLYQNNPQFSGLHIQFATQYIPKEREKPFGTADALYQCMVQFPALKELNFSVCNSDNLYSVKALKAVRTTKSNNTCVAYDIDHLDYPKERISHFAVIKFDNEYELQDIIEKPEADKINQYVDVKGKIRVSMNLFSFNGKVFFNHLKNCSVHPVRNEKELPTAIMNMIDETASMLGIPFAEHVPDLTSKKDIFKLEEYIAKHF
jgi:glucose-1-phosphate adenylyltransferase